MELANPPECSGGLRRKCSQKAEICEKSPLDGLENRPDGPKESRGGGDKGRGETSREARDRQPFGGKRRTRARDSGRSNERPASFRNRSFRVTKASG
jgi:hypothetical protein